MFIFLYTPWYRGGTKPQEVEGVKDDVAWWCGGVTVCGVRVLILIIIWFGGRLLGVL